MGRTRTVLALALGLIFVAAAGCDATYSDSEDPNAGNPNAVVERYCSYGAVSAAQLDGCLRSVTVEEINRLDTNAADFAHGDLDQCLEDAGPYCAPDTPPEESPGRDEEQPLPGLP